MGNNTLSRLHWSPNPSGEIFQKVELRASDPDYAKAVSGVPGDRKLSHVYLVQNDTHDKQFELEKQKMQKKYATGRPFKTPIEWRLFHGTKESAVNGICESGFDRSFAGTGNGTNYGAGCYFAREFEVAEGYAPASASRIKYVFVARVLVGAYQKGREDQKHPDESFDSTVDDVAAPKEFVVYRDARAYPQFLLEFA